MNFVILHKMYKLTEKILHRVIILVYYRAPLDFRLSDFYPIDFRLNCNFLKFRINVLVFLNMFLLLLIHVNTSTWFLQTLMIERLYPRLLRYFYAY